MRVCYLQNSQTIYADDHAIQPDRQQRTVLQWQFRWIYYINRRWQRG